MLSREIFLLVTVIILVAKSCPILLWPHELYPFWLLCQWDFLVKNTGARCHFLLQGIFPTQRSDPCLLRWQADSLPLSHPGRTINKGGCTSTVCMHYVCNCSYEHSACHGASHSSKGFTCINSYDIHYTPWGIRCYDLHLEIRKWYQRDVEWYFFGHTTRTELCFSPQGPYWLLICKRRDVGPFTVTTTKNT